MGQCMYHINVYIKETLYDFPSKILSIFMQFYAETIVLNG